MTENCIFMKKILLIFGLMCMFVLVSVAQDCRFNVRFSVTDATCFNNGKIAYCLLDENGNPIAENSLGTYHLRDVRIYSKVNETDSVHYSGVFYRGGVDTFLIDYGTYIIGLEGLCEDGHGGYFKVDTSTVLTINTTYRVPSISSFLVTDYTGEDLGRHPTLRCTNMGRIQLRIDGGRFPYTIRVVEHGTTDTLRTLVFYDHQYDGIDENRYDYEYYYTIDNLPAGEWDCYLVDGCEYGLPRTGQTVEVVPFPQLDYVELYASSGNMMDSNVIKINAVINAPYAYYNEMIPEYVQYRFIHDGYADGPWQSFSSFSSTNITLYDTIAEANSYCQIWNRNIGLQYKISGAPGCNDTVITRTFKFNKPNETKFEKKHNDVKDSMVDNLNDCKDKWRWHRDSYSIRYQSFQPNYLSKNTEHEVHRYHYTHPLTWVYKDLNTNTIIKQDTVGSINDYSSLFASEVEALYGPLPQTLMVERKLLDGHGCELYSTIDQLQYIIDNSEQAVNWSVSSSGNDHCCNSLRTISVSGTYSASVNPDGTIIRLVTSPYNNRYNFQAVYHSATSSWSVTRYSLENVAYIEGASNGRSLELKDYCLASGPYVFEVISPCDSFYLSKRISFPDVYSTELVEEPAFVVDKACTDQYVTYVAGQIARVSHNTSLYTGLELTPDTMMLPTKFQIVDGPVGGYEDREYGLNEQIRVTIPGAYFVKIFSTSNVESCETPEFYDMILYDNETVQYMYAMALLCDMNSTQGNVYVKGENGVPPYTYTLFSKPNKEGEIIGTNTTGIFPGIPLRTDSALSCMIMDACGAYFHVNFYPQLLADLQITWFDNGLKATTTCEGSTVTVHTLQSDNLFKYFWTGPNGFSHDSPEPFIFVPRGADDGWYKVTVLEGGCARELRDSIYLGVKKAPSVEILQNTTICPGEEVQLTFVPTSQYVTSTIDFAIVFETAEGSDIRYYQSPSGVAVTDNFSTLIPAKVYPLIIQDDECDYIHADPGDTVYISINPNVIKTCSINTQNDKVCYEGTGHLAAQSTVAVPYTIRWYSDIYQEHLLKEELITNAGEWSYYDTAGIMQQTLLYVSVAKTGYCPSIVGISTDVVTMREDTNYLNCDQSYRVYDSGGKDGYYSSGELIKQTFITTDGRQLALRMDELTLSNTSHLLVISGTELEMDSVMYDLTNISHVPPVIISNGNALTLYFMAGMVPYAGWSAVVEPVPGIAVADVYRKTHTVLYDEVCQSQSKLYDNPLNISPEIATLSDMNASIKHAGTHVFTYTYQSADSHHCDSTVTFVLTVTAPPFIDTTVVTSNFQLNGGSYHWRGNDYDETGRYSVIYTMEDGCDSLDILNLIVLQIDTSTNDICIGDETTMGIMVTTPRLTWKEGEIPAVNAPGDVLCTDGSLMRVDSFLLSNKVAKGVVYYLDRTGLHGKAVALEDAPTSYAIWASGPSSLYQSIHGKAFYPTQKDALFDLDGMGNTLLIKQYAEQAIGMEFSYNAPAAYYCYYYNSDIRGLRPSEASGWYMPSMGELNLIFGNRVAVNTTLKKLSGIGAHVMDLGTTYYISSSEANNNQCWHIDYSGHFATNTKSNQHRLRPSIDF